MGNLVERDSRCKVRTGVREARLHMDGSILYIQNSKWNCTHHQMYTHARIGELMCVNLSSRLLILVGEDGESIRWKLSYIFLY
jgi:hypothetical protein